MMVKVAFIGACGATLRHVLAWTLLDGHKAAALVRDASKLKKTLLDLGVSEEIQQSQLIVVTGSSRDVSTVRSLLLNDPEIIFSGITSTWKLRLNPFHPIAMDDAMVTGDSAAAVMQALKDLVSTNSISNSPIYAPISSTGHGSRRDQPLSLIPLYWWLLKEAQTDTAALERVTREAATQKDSGLGGYVMLRPPLLTDGEMKGTKKVRVGWIWEDDVLRKSDERETGVQIGYTISRLDLARWMFEELIQRNIQSWNGKLIIEDDFNVRVTDVGKLPVLITLTGEDSGLSQQLSFKSISQHVTKFISDTAVQVPLNIAIDFVIAQNQREIAVFGTQPDTVKSTLGFRSTLNVGLEALPAVVRSLGGGDEPIEMPSSTWVDTAIHTGWPRVNALDDEKWYRREETNERLRLLRRVAGVNPSYVKKFDRRKSV
ncbi:hypothetical protein LB504_001248 [Fusarium proliferatum]|nr:hypothetical protein LB504_001248 [Fusarium proliferatum]